jgi:hypothetical protein
MLKSRYRFCGDQPLASPFSETERQGSYATFIKNVVPARCGRLPRRNQIPKLVNWFGLPLHYDGCNCEFDGDMIRSRELLKSHALGLNGSPMRAIISQGSTATTKNQRAVLRSVSGRVRSLCSLGRWNAGSFSHSPLDPAGHVLVCVCVPNLHFRMSLYE